MGCCCGACVASQGGGDEVVKQADDMVLQVDEVDEGGFALDSVHRAEYVVKIMAILQNPSKVVLMKTGKKFPRMGRFTFSSHLICCLLLFSCLLPFLL